MRRLISFCIDNGVHGIVPLGSTGEYARLSVEERKRITDISIDEANGKVPVMVGTASSHTDLSIELSRYAQDAGADGLQIAAPYYGRPTDEEIYMHFKTIAESVDLPISVYNNPAATGIDIMPSVLARLSEIENIRYVKECSGDIKRVSQIIRRSEGKLTVFAGADNDAFESFAAGSKGWVSGIANFLPRECVQLYQLSLSKNDVQSAAQLYYGRLLPVGEVVETNRFVAYIKAGVELMEITNSGPLRRPLLSLSVDERQIFKDLLQEHGFLGIGPKAE